VDVTEFETEVDFSVIADLTLFIFLALPRISPLKELI
jgi:hypothetical protein